MTKTKIVYEKQIIKTNIYITELGNLVFTYWSNWNDCVLENKWNKTVKINLA